MISNPVPTALIPSSSERPAIEFCRLKILAVRNRDRVTGRVEFPYEVSGRTHVPIDYCSVRSDLKLDPVHSTIDHRRGGSDRT